MNKQRYDLSISKMTDQKVITRYFEETLKLKTLNQFGRQSERFLGYPNTGMMNRCKRELERRGLPIPRVRLEEGNRGNQESVFLSLIEAECHKARGKHPPLHSLHEAYAVLLEEVDELKEQIWKQSAQRDAQKIVTELAQIAAMAMRTVFDCLWTDEES